MSLMVILTPVVGTPDRKKNCPMGVGVLLLPPVAPVPGLRVVFTLMINSACPKARVLNPKQKQTRSVFLEAI